MLLLNKYIYLTLTALLVTGEDTDPCIEDNHVARYEEVYRSTTYITLDESRKMCDKDLLRNWYRFISKAGNDMPNQPPNATGACGTTFPVWLSEPILDTNEIQTLKVCMPFGNDPCDEEWSIRVKKCDGFNVYELIPTEGCPESYCIGVDSECPEGESSENDGFSPGCQIADFPILNGSVTVIPTVETLDGMPRVVLTCTIEEQTEDGSLWCEYTWTTETGKEILTSVQPCEEAGKLPETQWEEKDSIMGQNIHCNVRGKYDIDAFVGPEIGSHYFVGIRVLTPAITVYRAESSSPAVVMIQPTLPILCQGSGSGCSLEINIVVPEESTGDGEGNGNPAQCSNKTIDDIVFESRSCGIAINASQWDQVYNISIYPAYADVTYVNDVRYRLQLGTARNKEHDIWSDHQLFPISVHVAQTPPDSDDKTGEKSEKYCLVYNDPHIRTIDGREYDSHIPGEFILYRHLTLPIQVHGYFATCPGKTGITCVCGGAVQSGGDVFVYDKCRDDYPDRIRVYSCEDQSMKFSKPSENEYEVRLPTGALVRFSDTKIWIYPSKVETDQTQGMCGTFNLDCTDEFYYKDEPYPIDDAEFMADCGYKRLKSAKTEDFATSWTVTEEDSLYDGKAREFQNTWKQLDIYYCTCSDKHATCGYTQGDSQQPCIESDNDPTDDLLQSCLARKSRENNKNSPINYFDDDVEDEVGDFPFRGSAPLDPDTSWKNGWDSPSATEYCTTAIVDNDGYEAIKDISGINIADTIEACVLDIQYAGDVSYTQGHLSNLLSTGAVFTQKNFSLWHTDEDGGSSNPPNEILDRVCPGNCNNQGTCTEGKCLCHANFTGIDCSFYKNAVPKLFNLPSGGECDKATRPCSMTPVYADVFLNSENLTCHFKHILFINNEKKPGLAYTVTGIYSHTQKIYCNLPIVDLTDQVVPGQEFVISVSNDGTNPSDEKSLMVYDGRCMNCSVDGVCKQKVKTCFIDNNCLLDRAVSPNNPCQLCDPDSNNAGWTKSLSDECVAHNGLGGGAIAGIAVVCVAVLAVMAAVGLVVKHKNKNKIHGIDAMPSNHGEMDESST